MKTDFAYGSFCTTFTCNTDVSFELYSTQRSTISLKASFRLGILSSGTLLLRYPSAHQSVVCYTAVFSVAD